MIVSSSDVVSWYLDQPSQFPEELKKILISGHLNLADERMNGPDSCFL
jgi:hypothetical protein